MKFFSVLNGLRKRYFISIFIDISIIFFLIINIVNNLYFYDFLILTSFFIVINYLSGKYRINNLSSYKEFLIYIFKILICSFEYLILLSLYLHYFKNNFLLINGVQLLFIIIFLFISSSFIQLFINNIAFKLRLKKSWIFIGDELIYNLLLSEIKYFKLYNYNIIRYQENTDRQLNIDQKKINGFIVSSDDYLNKKQKKGYLFSSKKIILNTIVWFEKYLYKLPPFLISNSNYLDVLSLKIKTKKFQFKLKRFGDIFVSIILLIITSPLLILSAILIKIEDRGPIFYKQVRNGLNKKTFEIIKLRTMNVNAEKEGAKWSTFSDNRVTKIGKILRLFRLDELPQLLLVFTGEMSLIGPRPERPEFDLILANKIKYYDYRYKIKPGISGWAQVNYPYGSSIDDASQKLSYDLYYLNNYNNFIDFIILFKTMRLIFNGNGSLPRNLTKDDHDKL